MNFRANRHLVTREQPTEETKMLYSITNEGKLKIHRNLAKWRSEIINKQHAVYYSEAPSRAEYEANLKIQALISRCTKEAGPVDTESVTEPRL